MRHGDGERAPSGSLPQVPLSAVPVIAATALAAALVTTWASAGGWFVCDDLGELHRAEHGDTRGAHTRPLVTLLHRANRSVSGLDPLGYHAVNIALHAVVIGLVAWAGGRLAAACGLEPKRAARTGLGAAAWFALLATHAEAVSWISTRGDLVAASAAMVAVGAWVDRERGGMRVLATVALVLGLAAKEQAVAIGPMCVVVALGTAPRGAWHRRSAARRALREALPLVVVTVAYVAIRAAVLGSLVGSYREGGVLDGNPLRVVPRILAMAVRTVVPGTTPRGWLLVVGIASSAVAVAWHRRADVADAVAGASGRLVAVAVALALVALLPGAGLGISLTDGRGDRLLYLASTASAIALSAVAESAFVAARSARGRRAVVAVATALLVLSGSAAIARDRAWGEAGDLARATLTGPAWSRARPVVVLNPADTLRGAYVHRNALGDTGVVAHGWPSPSYVQGLAPMELDDADAEIAMVSVGPDTYRMTPDDGARFLPGPGSARSWQVGGVRAGLGGDGVLTIALPADMPLGDVWYLTHGRFVPLGGDA